MKIGVTFSKAPCRNDRLPKGDEFLQDTSQEDILRMIDQTPSGKARDILVACHKRKAGMSLHAISDTMMGAVFHHTRLAGADHRARAGRQV